MEPAFWRARWAEGRTGFHRDAPNPLLTDNMHRMGLAEGARVLVPLCGKTLDLLWLADQGFQVVGVELTEIACRSFIAASGRSFTQAESGRFLRFHSPGIELLCGDFFSLESSLLGPIDAIWDRAALIALPEALRTRYVALIDSLASSGTRLLLATIEYPQEERGGPPLSV